MIKNSQALDILKIVKEDILEDLKNKNDEILLSSVEPEIKVSPSFISRAIAELEKEGMVKINKREKKVYLTKKGSRKAQNIIGKHAILEKYFVKTKNDRKEAYRLASIFEHYVSVKVINNIKKLTTLKETGIPLTEFQLHRKGLISDIVFHSWLFERMVSMGILPGEEINKRSQIASVVIIEAGNKKFALSREIAGKIKVIKT
jgi:Mn-dependent DtxR family transcriptional regulator